MNVDGFLDAMRFFGEPKRPEGGDLAVVFAAYQRELGRYRSDVLQLAADQLIAKRNHRNFPLLAECLQACRDAQEQIAIQQQREAENAHKTNPKPSGDPWSEQRVRQADRMMASEIGRLAAEEGWIIHLHDWCREQGRLPNKFEGEKVRAKGLAIKAEREEMARKGGASNPIVKSIARAMISKRNRLSAIAFGRDAA